MVDMAMISGTMSALKAAGEITKLIIASHDANVIREKAIELQAQIFTAQQNALTAQSDQFTLLQRVRDLKKQIADLEAWDTEKLRYEMKRLASGGIVYSLKVDASGSEPPHDICAACYQRGKKFFLQAKQRNAATAALGMPSMLMCPECKTEIVG
jgi:hypothetical protein